MKLRRYLSAILFSLLSVQLSLAAANTYCAPNDPRPPDIPPRASLLQVSPPDDAQTVIVSGRPGAAPPGTLVLNFTLETGHAADAVAREDGSFTSSRLFAPPGTSILVQSAQTDIAAVRAAFGYPLASMACFPGTIIRSGEPAAVQSGVAFAGAGQTNHPQGLPVWTFQGSIPSQRYQPGVALRITGTLRIASPVLRTAGNMEVRAILRLERLSGANGRGALGENTFASVLMTPTGLPIEHETVKLRVPPPPNLPPIPNWFFPVRKTGDVTAAAEVDISWPLPSDLPSGLYRPSVGLFFQGVPLEAVDSTKWPELNRAERQPEGSPLMLPIIQVGSPAPPQLFWTMLTEDLSNGTRGTRAIEDRNSFGFAPRILTQSETFIVAPGSTHLLEPFAPTISISQSSSLPSIPLIPFQFPSGRLTVRVRRPDGSTLALGPSPFVQSRMRGFGAGPTGHDTMLSYQLSTMDPQFEVAFGQDGLYTITVQGEISDIWGNTWTGGGTYHVYAARTLSLDTAVLPGAMFEVGDVIAPGVTISPAVPADVEVRVQLLPDSDARRRVERTIQGQANRFGYFHVSGGGVALEQQGEYRVDLTASWRDAEGRLWMGSRTWGGVVASRNPRIIVHGRRGTDTSQVHPQWFTRAQIGVPIGGDHVRMAFHSGDVMWLQKSDSLNPLVTFQDPIGSLATLLQRRHPPPTQDEVATGEIPLSPTRLDGQDPHLDPARVDLWAYSYAAVERPLVRVREEILGGQSSHTYWRFDNPYARQIGAGPQGDLPNDFKFQYAGAGLYGSALAQPDYGVYGSLFVLVPDADSLGTRVFPPFQGNGGGPSGGPLFELKGKPIEGFIHLTGVRPGSVLETGDTFALAGAVAPLLPAQVSVTVSFPSGRRTSSSGRANKVGYYYRPQDDFIVAEPGIYAVDVSVTFDGRTSAGPLTPPYPVGDVLGSPAGRFYVYVVPRGSAPLVVDLPEISTLRGNAQFDLTAASPGGMTLRSGHITSMMPGFILQTGDLPVTSGSLAHRHDPAALVHSFPNLDVDPPADLITITLFAAGVDGAGNATYAAKILNLHGADLFNPPAGSPTGMTFAAPALGGFIVASSGQSTQLTTGYARVFSGSTASAPAGMAIFGLRKGGVLITEASVPATALARTGRIFAEVDGALNTGIAIANPNAQDAVVTFVFTGASGVVAAQGSTALRAGEQIARFLDQPPFNGRAPFLGTFSFNSTQPIASLALRGRNNERGDFLITTLPVTDSVGEGDQLLPHFADGSGWSTEVVLVNPGDRPLNGNVHFFSPAGRPVAVTIDGASASTISYALPPHGVRRLRTAGTGTELLSGAVRVAPDAGNATPSAFLVFSSRKDGVVVSEASVPGTSAGSAFRLYAEASQVVASGIAIANASSTAATTVTLELTGLDGSPTGLKGTLSLGPGSQTSRFVNQIDGLTSLPVPFQGILRISTSGGGRIVVAALRGRNNERGDFLITTTPGVDEAATAGSGEIFFPYIADGEGYTTQFILLGGSGTLQFFAQTGERLGLSVR